MPAANSPQELKAAISRGLLSFPLTDFDASGEFDAKASARRLEWLASYPAGALFMAGGAGEFFSLTPAEYSAVIGTAVRTWGAKTPFIAGTGYGTRTAISYAQEAERLGADGLLLMPPYLTEAPQAGLRAHITAVCRATRLGVVVYNRANCRLGAQTVARIAEECPNLIGFKDGVGDLELLTSIKSMLGARLALINGMPTAETYARAFRAVGFATYSSAVFNFVPRTALQFYDALERGDDTTIDKLLKSFFVPYVAIRNKQPGNAVSIVKAGAAIVGRSAGKVRPPLSDLAAEDYKELQALIEKLGPQE
ncbi:MAG TPA: 5-dehydro-4-deoxyglucarate dehydratase [Xanthobacteraceae bacterium]